MANIQKSSRKSVFVELKEFDLFAKKDDYIEVTEWTNGEGFDVEICGVMNQRFQMTYGAYKALKKLVKTIENNN